MRILLLHNPKAGDRKHKKKDLLSALVKAGHDVTYQSVKERGYEKALDRPVDVVLAGGGDGTVAKVAKQLIGTDVPLAVLPLGTANNLARTFGFCDSPDEIIKRLEGSKRRAVDVGVARGPWGKRYFFESAGGGLLADYLAKAAREKEKKSTKSRSPEQEMKRHVSRMRQLLEDHPARRWKIKGDAKDLTDPYILWEAMNIRSVGPVLLLAPGAATKDGRFDFVYVRDRKRERARFMKHLRSRLKREGSLRLPTRHVRTLKIDWNGSRLHFDDNIWPWKKHRTGKRNGKIEITIKSQGLVVFSPVAANH